MPPPSTTRTHMNEHFKDPHLYDLLLENTKEAVKQVQVTLVKI